MTVQHINSKVEFDALLANFNGVILADFFATWCGPCKVLGPVLDEIAAESNPDQVKIVKIDVDEAGELAAEYGITSVPTVFIGVKGEIKEGFMGANTKQFYLEKIQHYAAL